MDLESRMNSAQCGTQAGGVLRDPYIRGNGGIMRVSGRRHVVFDLSDEAVHYEGSYAECKTYTETSQHGMCAILAPCEIVSYEHERIVKRERIHQMPEQGVGQAPALPHAKNGRRKK